MPGKAKDVKEAVTISIAGEEWELAPAQGWRGMIVVPKIISLLSEMIYGASRAEIDLRTLIDENGINFSAIRAENLLAFKYIADILAKNWQEISMEIMPVLLNKEAKFLANEGTWIEHLRALNAAVNFHAPYLLGDDTWSGLKKSFVEAEEEEANQDTTTDSDKSET